MRFNYVDFINIELGSLVSIADGLSRPWKYIIFAYGLFCFFGKTKRAPLDDPILLILHSLFFSVCLCFLANSCAYLGLAIAKKAAPSVTCEQSLMQSRPPTDILKSPLRPAACSLSINQVLVCALGFFFRIAIINTGNFR